MNGYSYKEFMVEVKERLTNFSAEELRNLISGWAAEETPSNRQEFLNKLNVLYKKQIVKVDTDLLWDEIEAFAQDVENGEYYEGYGWDSDIMEERDFGDESWVEEMDAFFLGARDLLREGDYKVGEAVYKKIFEILEQGEETGYLPGALHPSDMLEIDLKEHVALFIRSVYMNTAHEARASALYTSMQKHEYLVSPKVKLADSIEAM